MFEDEMTESNLARTAEEYFRVTASDRHEEALAQAKAYIASLEATVFMLKRQARESTRALMAIA